jgi:hypothetical protein
MGIHSDSFTMIYFTSTCYFGQTQLVQGDKVWYNGLVSGALVILQVGSAETESA